MWRNSHAYESDIRVVIMRVLITGLLYLFLVLLSRSVVAEEAHSYLNLLQLKHIQFDDIPANRIHVSPDHIKIHVNASASFLMRGFDDVQSVSKVYVHWKSTGSPGFVDIKHETQKDGDDAVLKVALMLEGKRTGFDWFLPDWIKQVRSEMKHESSRMIYLVAGSQQAPGTSWPNPYNEDITMIAMNNVTAADGVTVSSYSFDTAARVAGIWMMADGDNTASSFSTEVLRLELE